MCPVDGDPYPHSSLTDIPASEAWLNTLKGYTSSALAYLPLSLGTYLAETLPLQAVNGFRDQLLSIHPSQIGTKSDKAILPACPYTWSKPIAKLNCDIAWPAGYTGAQGEALIELDTDAYLGRLGREKTMEKLLAMGGIRLAHLMNVALSGKDGVYLQY